MKTTSPACRPPVSRRLLATLALAACAALLHGCVSTEALYAEYDEFACRVALEPVAGETVRVREIATGETMHWEPMIGFAFDSAALDEREKRRLDRDVAVLLAYPELRVILRGFTDSMGSAAYNSALAARRVASVAAYLRAQGIDRTRFGEVSFGEGLPLVGNATGNVLGAEPDAGSVATADSDPDSGGDDTGNGVEPIEEKGEKVPVNRRVELLLTDAGGRPVPVHMRPLAAGEGDDEDEDEDEDDATIAVGEPEEEPVRAGAGIGTGAGR